jgi:hypothetical protein
MGYRHQVISGLSVPNKSELPGWFLDKYEAVINFDGNYWHSKCEYKRYGILKDFDKDVQKVMVEVLTKGVPWTQEIKLVYFADERESLNPDISHVTITKKSIVEIEPDGYRRAARG